MCFLGPEINKDGKISKSFPVCIKDTCEVSTKGLYAAYIQAKKWGKSPENYKGSRKPKFSQMDYANVMEKAKKLLADRGIILKS